MPKKVSYDEYISRLNTIHHNIYDYTLLPHDMSTSTRITVGCLVHGLFTPTLSAHLQGSGCPQCNWDAKKKATQIKLIERATKIHNGVYDYTKVDYTNKDLPVVIGCPKHGDFKMRLWNHVYGPDKCPLCGSGKKRTTADFITLAKEVHGDRYNYSASVYKNATTKVTILCDDHGPFEQTPDMHCLSNQQGCPKCKASSGERAIYKTLVELGVADFICEKQFDECIAPDTQTPLRFDFWVPSHNTLIEYDGQGHFTTVNFSGELSQDIMQGRLERAQYLDNIKNDYANANGYTLLRIPYTEYTNIHNILAQRFRAG